MKLEMAISVKPQSQLCIILKKIDCATKLLQEANSIVGSVFHSIIPLSSVPKRSITALTSKETFVYSLFCI